MVGVVKLEPVPTATPPLDTSYQSMVVPAALVADKTTVPAPHLDPFTGLVGDAGRGLTTTVTLVVLAQLPDPAEIVNVVVCCEFWLLVNVPVIVEPVPLAAIPVRLLVFVRVQLNVVPGTLFGLLIAIDVMEVPEHVVCVEGVAVTVGPGFTVMVAVVVLEHPAAVDAVIVNVVV